MILSWNWLPKKYISDLGSSTSPSPPRKSFPGKLLSPKLCDGYLSINSWGGHRQWPPKQSFSKGVFPSAFGFNSARDLYTLLAHDGEPQATPKPRQAPFHSNLTTADEPRKTIHIFSSFWGLALQFFSHSVWGKGKADLKWPERERGGGFGAGARGRAVIEHTSALSTRQLCCRNIVAVKRRRCRRRHRCQPRPPLPPMSTCPPPYTPPTMKKIINEIFLSELYFFLVWECVFFSACAI